MGRDDLRSGAWAIRAAWICRRQLASGRVDDVVLPSSAALPARGGPAVSSVLHRLPYRCLTRSLVLQAWRADHGDPVDVVIGVKVPASGFAAHAWLDGSRAAADFLPIHRVRPTSAVDGIAATARSLLCDRLAVEVSGAFRAAGVRALLLKGAAIVTWLYDEGEVRPYGDTDLLVSPGDFERAEEVLRGLGFVLTRPGLSPLEETEHSRTWVRRGEVVDLHHRLWGVGAEPQRAWEVLTESTDRVRFGGRPVECLGLPARTLHVALHAAQHGTHECKPRQDLARAATRVSVDVWREAADLARRLEADGVMAAGLRLEPASASLVEELGLPIRVPVAVRLYADGAPPAALGLARVVAASGFRAKAVAATRRAVPTPNRMRARYGFAGRGPVALGAAYVWRMGSLARQVPAVVAALGRAWSPRRGSLSR